MTHPSTIQGFKEFEDRFGGGDESGDYPSKAIKSHFHSLFLTLANERIESLRVLESKNKKPRRNTGSYGDNEFNSGFYNGYGTALSEEIAYWENFIKELNEIR